MILLNRIYWEAESLFRQKMIDSLKFWLKEIAQNPAKYTHWEISCIMGQFFYSSYLAKELKNRIDPLLMALSERGKTHKHKSLVAEFALSLLKEYEQIKESRKNDPDNLDFF